MISRRAMLAGAVGLGACGPQLAKRFDGYCFVANKGSRSLAVLNLSRFRLDKQIPLEGEPEAVVTHAGGKAVLVLLPDIGTVVEVPASALTVSRKKKMAGRAVAMRVSGDRVWVLGRDPNVLVPLDLKTWKSGPPIPLPYAATDFDIAPDGATAVVSYGEKKRFGLFGLAGSGWRNEIPMATDAGVVKFRLDGKQVLIGSAAGRTITVADRETGRVLVVLPMPFAPERFCFNDNGGQMFATGAGMDAVGIVYPYQTELAETVLAGREPGAMTVNSSLLFVTNPTAGDVTVLSIAERQVVARITSGQGPCAVALTPDGEYCLVVNRGSGNLAVVRLSKLTDLRYKKAPLFTVVAVGDEPVAAAVCRL